MDRPSYIFDRIQSIQSLSRALGVSERRLQDVARRAPALYIGPIPKPKKDGKIRHVFDTKPPLKRTLKKINQVFFKRVEYPPYLTGSLPGRDFVDNVAIHAGARRGVSEDIRGFFDFITAKHVYRVWREFFGFADEVADILTRLTTRDGRVFQGTPTSSYLANLVFWDREPALVDRLSQRNIRYSRYVDDITITVASEMRETDRSWAISQIYGVLGGAGFKPQRAKQHIYTARGPITIMGLNANSRGQPTLTRPERARIRASVFQLEKRLANGVAGPEFKQDLDSVAGKVGRLKRLHEKEGTALHCRLNAIRAEFAMPSVNRRNRCDEKNKESMT